MNKEDKGADSVSYPQIEEHKSNGIVAIIGANSPEGSKAVFESLLSASQVRVYDPSLRLNKDEKTKLYGMMPKLVVCDTEAEARQSKQVVAPAVEGAQEKTATITAGHVETHSFGERGGPLEAHIQSRLGRTTPKTWLETLDKQKQARGVSENMTLASF